jgi:hypothetical protein
MAMALVDIVEYQKVAAQAERDRETIAHTRPVPAGLVISEPELTDMANFEERIDSVINRANAAHTEIAKAKTRFLALLPKSVHEEMRTQGRAVYASWVDRANQRSYGPYAAYFSGEELIIEAFPNGNYHDFVARFERMRAEEKASS